jgi:hypothetical protein
MRPHDQFIDAVMILFRRGMNTADIANKWVCHEWLVTRALHIGLERRRAGRLVDAMGANV